MEHPLAVDFVRWIVLLPLLGAAMNFLTGALIQRAFGKRAISVVGCGAVAAAFAIAVYAWVRMLAAAPADRFMLDDLWRWIHVGPLNLDIALPDPVAAEERSRGATISRCYNLARGFRPRSTRHQRESDQGPSRAHHGADVRPVAGRSCPNGYSPWNPYRGHRLFCGQRSDSFRLVQARPALRWESPMQCVRRRRAPVRVSQPQATAAFSGATARSCRD